MGVEYVPGASQEKLWPMTFTGFESDHQDSVLEVQQQILNKELVSCSLHAHWRGKFPYRCMTSIHHSQVTFSPISCS